MTGVLGDLLGLLWRCTDIGIAGSSEVLYHYRCCCSSGIYCQLPVFYGTQEQELMNISDRLHALSLFCDFDHRSVARSEDITPLCTPHGAMGKASFERCGACSQPRSRYSSCFWRASRYQGRRSLPVLPPKSIGRSRITTCVVFGRAVQLVERTSI